MKHDFMEKTARIIAEVRNRTSIDDDAEVIKEILQEELHKCYAVGYDYGYIAGKSSLGYSEVDIDNAYAEGRSDGYALGYDDGLNEAVDTEEATYSRGFEDGRAEAESDNEAYTKDAVEYAYDEGYSEGRSAGYSEGRSDGYDEGHSVGYDDGVNGDF